ncbi:MAG: hypothetical protein HY366_00345 [Candidatus Aenigmarchaeota archaeon]|nr:hypothetical protein [Candidatus Aenigmarchaeota archaeon]
MGDADVIKDVPYVLQTPNPEMRRLFDWMESIPPVDEADIEYKDRLRRTP